MPKSARRRSKKRPRTEAAPLNESVEFAINRNSLAALMHEREIDGVKFPGVLGTVLAPLINHAIKRIQDRGERLAYSRLWNEYRTMTDAPVSERIFRKWLTALNITITTESTVSTSAAA